MTISGVAKVHPNDILPSINMTSGVDILPECCLLSMMPPSSVLPAVRAIGKIMHLELQIVHLLTMTFLLMARVDSQEQEQGQQSTPQTFPVYQPPSFHYNNQRHENSFIVNRVPSNNRRYSSLYEAEGHLGRQALHLMLTSNRRLPWACTCDMFWRDLGEDFHPRFIRDARCSTSTCYHGHYSCTPSKYNVPVLKRILPTDEVDDNERVFDSEFYFVSVQVTSSCYCGRNTNDS